MPNRRASLFRVFYLHKKNAEGYCDTLIVYHSPINFFKLLHRTIIHTVGANLGAIYGTLRTRRPRVSEGNGHRHLARGDFDVHNQPVSDPTNAVSRLHHQV